METLAIIPARGGSKRLPRKNLLPIAGQPLISHTIGQALRSRAVARVLVSTDDEEIAEVSRHHGVEVIMRPPVLATDKVSSIPALKHVLQSLETAENYRPDLVVFLQCTSPIRKDDDIDRAVEAFAAGDIDCMFSACRFKDYIWRAVPGRLESLNFDYRKNWWRGQDFPPQFRSNGSIFVYRAEALKAAERIFFGRLSIYEMDYLSSFQIDTPEDFELCKSILELIKRKGQVL